MAVDTLFLCFAEDKDLADNTGHQMVANPELKVSACEDVQTSSRAYLAAALHVRRAEVRAHS